MSPRTVDQADNWDAVPYDGGYGGLQDLASDEFSGLVTAGPTRLFMIRGTVVGILDGSMDAFEGADGTAREAPHPALALLAVMQERSDEVRAKYYTEETPVSDVDSTLANGGFTGYVELSENVLSGDYYLVYHRGESMSVAYVGASERLITDDDAFEQADDEVGIFEVRPVDVEPIEIPDPPEAAGETATGAPSDAGADDAAATDAAAIDADATTSDSGDVDGDASGGSAEADAASASGDGADGSAGATAAGSTTAESGTVEGAPSESGTDDDTGTTSEPPADGSRPSTDEGPSSTDEGPSSTDEGPSSTDEAQTSADETTGSQPSAAASDRSGGQTTENEADSERSRRSDPERPSGQNSATADHSERANDHPAANADRAANTDGSARDPSRQSAAGNSSRPPDDGEDQANASRPPAGASPDRQRGDSQAAGGSPSAAGSGGSAADLETRSIPSLNPSRTHAASADATPDAGSAPVQSGGDRRPGTADQQADTRSPGTGAADESTADGSSEGQRAETTGRDRSDRSQGTTRASQSQSADGREEGADNAATLRTELAEREQELENLRSDLQRVEAERDDLRTERDDLEAERDRLQSELEEARAEIERLEERLADFGDDGDAATAETQLSAREAIDQTNLFVRYDSKGEATLASAHAGDADRSTVGENLRLEYHTQFDADETAVGSASFDEFLPGTVQYRFVDWLVGSLLYEIRDTGHTDAMADLYGALPKIDRAELNGQVTVQYTENGEEHRSQEGFDVVVRNRMGNPLVVANINESRDPASESMMTDLVKRAERVGESNGSLAAAFLVTESFFEPEALETAEEATSNGLFSRDSRKSFVNLSRKDGYHLCLVEARNREFHLAVPEL